MMTEEPIDKNEVDPINYIYNKRELVSKYKKKDVYEYWGKEFEGIYHEIFEYNNSVYEGLRDQLGLPKTYIYFVETKEIFARAEGFETHHYIRLSTGLIKRLLEIPRAMNGVYRALPCIVDAVNSGLISPHEWLVFILGTSGLVCHEIGHVAQAPDARQYWNEVHEKQQGELSREKIVESHLSEWDADNFSAVLMANRILEYFTDIDPNRQYTSILEELIILAMLGKFLVHNVLASDEFEIYYLTGDHPCSPMRIVNYCSRITSLFQSLGYNIDERFIIQRFGDILDEYGKKGARSSFMEAMKFSVGNEYYDIIQQEREKSKSDHATKKIVKFMLRKVLEKHTSIEIYEHDATRGESSAPQDLEYYDALKRIGVIYSEFCENHPELEFIDSTMASPNSCIVKIRVKEGHEVTSSDNAPEENGRITREWSELVYLNEAVELAKRADIWILSIQQIDVKGESHSVAIF